MDLRLRARWERSLKLNDRVIGLPAVILIVLGSMIVVGVITHAMGHPLICKCGYFKLWHGGLLDAEVSQHLFDWYTPSHVVHGIVIYGVMWLLMRHKPSLRSGLIVAVLFASVWEILENTAPIVHSVGLTTRVVDYTGDSVIATIGDMLATMLGCAAATYLPIWCSALLVVGSTLLPHDNPWFVAAIFYGDI
jgi:Protein of unknown function (DUF2585)